MQSRDLPARPHLEQLKRQAKELHGAFLAGDADAIARVESALGPTAELKLTGAQRALAREYGFPSWAQLRTHVLAARGLDGDVDAFLAAVAAGDGARAAGIVRLEPALAESSLDVAAALGREDEVRRALRAGTPPGDSLLWLCRSPFHGESPERDDALAAAARALLDAGADPNARAGEYELPALYFVTGARDVPRIARLLLEAGANPTDGESVHHAAESFHEEALRILLEFGVDLDRTGEWGNTPLYFLLRHWEVDPGTPLDAGVRWLLGHGADPNVRCGREQETALHVAARRGRRPEVVRLLLEHGADVDARRGDGRTARALARRGGFDEIAALLEEAGAAADPLPPGDRLLAACGAGDAEAARRLTTPELVAALDPAALRLLPEAVADGRPEVVRACLAAGLPVDTPDEYGATALHHAAIRGDAALVRELLGRGADFRIRDDQHRSPALGWATHGADFVAREGGDYEGAVRALLDAGARLTPDEHEPEHPGVREVLQAHAS